MCQTRVCWGDCTHKRRDGDRHKDPGDEGGSESGPSRAAPSSPYRPVASSAQAQRGPRGPAEGVPSQTARQAGGSGRGPIESSCEMHPRVKQGHKQMPAVRELPRPPPNLSRLEAHRPRGVASLIRGPPQARRWVHLIPGNQTLDHCSSVTGGKTEAQKTWSHRAGSLLQCRRKKAPPMHQTLYAGPHFSPPKTQGGGTICCQPHFTGGGPRPREVVWLPEVAQHERTKLDLNPEADCKVF